MVTRRKVLSACAVVGTAGVAGRLFAEGAVVNGSVGTALSRMDFGFVGPEDDPEFGDLITGRDMRGGSAVAPGPSRHDEVAKAFRLLFDVPRNSGHFAAARYFEQLADKNTERESYKAEWTKRANPLIVGFFSMTNTKPSGGDQTHWCAAFVNFCLYATGRPTTFSALSGSFRKYGDPTDTPAEGDVVVFAKAGDDGKKGFGHVGFYVGQRNGKIVVLGGNQVGNTGTTGSVTEAEFAHDGKGLFLHSYRKVKVD